MTTKPYQFDGLTLRDRQNRAIAKVEGGTVRNARGIQVGRVDHPHVLDPAGRWVVSFDGVEIRDRLGRKIGTIEAVRELIDGDGGITLVALWLFFAR